MTHFTETVRVGWKALSTFAVAHKLLATITTIALLYGSYVVYGKLSSPAGETSYTTTTVATSTVVATLSESGTVSATSNISIAAKASGTVLSIYLQPGTHVAAGAIIAKIDPTDTAKALRDAQLSLEAAQLTYEKSVSDSTDIELLQAKNAVTSAQINLEKTRDASYASIASTYTDLNTIIAGLDSVLHDANVSSRSNQKNIDAYSSIVSSHDDRIEIYRSTAETAYSEAYTAYNTALSVYKTVPRSASTADLIDLAQTTYIAAQKVADATKNAHDFFDRVKTDFSLYTLGSSSELPALISSVTTYTTTITNDLSSVLTIKATILSAEQTLAVNKDSLQTTTEGPDDLARKSAAITLQKAEEAVQTAQENLADTFVRAPFSGTLASISIDQYQTISSGATVATMVSDTKVAELSVSEGDAIKIKPGQKTTLTFDALPDVTIAGTIVSVSTAGSVSSGVVSYTVEASLDTQNEDIHAGMSVTADIITGVMTGISVPNSAIKVSGSTTYVLTFDPALENTEGTSIVSSRVPTKTTVTTGLAGDTNTIITNGLVGGEQIVTKTTTTKTIATTAKTASSQRSALGGMGGGPGL